MRAAGLSVALVAGFQLALFSTPAFAQGPDAPAAPPATPPATAPAPSNAGLVMVHINSPSAVTLQHRTGDAGHWEDVCTSPCDTQVPVGDQYQIIAPGANPSKPFTLDASKGGPLTLNVAPASQTNPTVGYAALGIGGALAVTGVILLIAGTKPSNVGGTASDDATTHSSHTGILFAGSTLLILGATAALYGGSQVIASDSTVAGDVQKAQPAQGRVPTFRTAKEEGPVPVTAPAFVFPILQGRF